MNIENKRQFDKNFSRKDLRKKENLNRLLFFLSIILITVILFAYKANQYRNYDPSKLKLSKSQSIRLFSIIEESYSNVDLAERNKRKELIQKLKEERIIQEIEFQEEIRKQLEKDEKLAEEIKTLTEENQKLVNEIAVIGKDFNLAELDELDDILANFSEAYTEDVKKDLELSRSVAAARVSRNREIRAFLLRPSAKKNNLLDIGDIESKKVKYQGFRTKDEIKQIDKVMRKNEFLIESCITKFKLKERNKRGFLKVEFYIDSLGTIRNESIRILETNIKSKDLFECIVKRIKYIRGFEKASRPNANDYIYRKKYVF